MLGKHLVEKTAALIRSRKIVNIQLSDIECKIVNEYQADGLADNNLMACELGYDKQNIRNRAKNLRRVGCIKGVHADINYQLIGLLEFIAIVALEDSSVEKLNEYEDLINKWPEIQECNMICNSGDFLLKFLVTNKRHMDRVTLALTAMQNVNNVLTFPIVHTKFVLHGTPFEGLAQPPPLKTVFGGGYGHRNKSPERKRIVIARLISLGRTPPPPRGKPRKRLDRT